jgi:hypothetical protein
MAAKRVAGLHERCGLDGDRTTRRHRHAPDSLTQARGELESTLRSAKFDEVLPNSHQPSIHGFT